MNPCTTAKPLHASPFPLRPAEVERLRGLLRKVRPVLVGQGWSEEDVGRIGPVIKAAIDRQDVDQVRDIAMWLGGKLKAETDGIAVRPVLPLQMELKHLDREWKRGTGR